MKYEITIVVEVEAETWEQADNLRYGLVESLEDHLLDGEAISASWAEKVKEDATG